MNIAAFVDLDNTVVKEGTQEELFPGAFDYVRRVCKKYDVYFFSCWAFTDQDIAFLIREFPKAKGFIRKPFADGYILIDDKAMGSMPELKMMDSAL